jgi:ArsR family transcriptional regulator, arsenate/arsenite/antimonite-responsive transcriptional repressor
MYQHARKHRQLSICSFIMETMPKLLPVIEMATEPCCAPLAEAPLSDADANALATRLKAVADPARLRLVSLVLASPGQEACICDLTEPLGLSQPTVSHHMKVLADAGLLVREKRGRWAYFRARPQAFEALAQALHPTSTA